MPADNIAGNSREVARGVRDVNAAFLELSQTGKLTNGTMEGFIALAFKITPVLGAMAEGVYLVYESFQLLKQVDLNDAIAGWRDDTILLNEQWDIATSKSKAMAGQTGELGEKLGKLAEVQAKASAESAKHNAQVQKYTQLVKEGKVTEEQAIASIQASDKVREDAIQTYDDEAAALQKTIAALEQYQKWLQATERNYELLNAKTLQMIQTQAGNNGAAIFFGTDEALAKKIKAHEQMIEKLDAEMKKKKDLALLSEAEETKDIETLNMLERETAALKEQQRVIAQLGDAINATIGGTGAAAFDAYAASMDKTISLNNVFSDSTGRAFRNAEASVLKSLGQTAAVHMAEELAYAASTALNPASQALYGPPSQHLEAAALWAGVAALAGVGAGALSVSSGGGGGGSNGGMGGGGGGGGSNGGSGATVNVTVIGALDAQQRADLAAQIAAEIEGGNL